MTHAEHQAIIKLASAARTGLESLVSSDDSMFCTFPFGTCGPAAELVGRVLAERLGLASWYVCGSDHPDLAANQSHAWTEVGPFIVDLTHDQFDSTGVAGWVTLSSSHWHERFRERHRRVGFCMPLGWPMYPHRAYRAIVAQLDAAIH
jgi:hypothetical protein